MTIANILPTVPPVIVTGESTAEAKRQAGIATAAAATASSEAERSESFALAMELAAFGIYYDSLAEGAADVAEGEAFIVVAGGRVTLASKVGGVGVAQAEFATSSSLNTMLAAVETADDLAALTNRSFAYVSDFDARYYRDPASAATADGYGVIASADGGRWLLASDGITLKPGGGDDGVRLMAAGNAMAALGKVLRVTAGTYALATQWSWPTTAPLTLIMCPATKFAHGLNPAGIGTPPSPSPSNAALYCAPGEVERATTLAAANVVSNYTISTAASAAVGEMVRVRDTGSGGFRGSRYMVRGVSGSGPYTLTLDRPVLTQFASGDAVDIWSSRRAFGHRIYGNGATVTGTGTRLVEFIGTEDCEIRDLTFLPDNCETVGSFDTFGHDNHWIGCTAIAGASGADNGLMLETQERSTIDRCKASGFAVDGIRLLNDESCEIDADCWGNAFGISVGGEANLLGCNGTIVRGRYDGNTVEGISVIVGSRGTLIDAVARFNPTNLVIGDGGGGNVTGTRVRGDFSNGTAIGITVVGSAIGTDLEHVTTSGSTIGLNVAGATVAGQFHRHLQSAATHILYNAGGNVELDFVDYNVATAGINAIIASGASATRLRRGAIAAGNGSNLLNLSNTSTASLGAITATVGGGGFLATATSGTTLRLDEETDYGATSGLNGAGRFIRPASDLVRQIGAAPTSAVTTEEVLRTVTLGPREMIASDKLEVRAFGSFAANANTKTVRLKFGGQTVGTITGALNGEEWEIVANIYATSLTAESFAAELRHGTALATDTGALTVDVTSSPAVAITGQNGTASASDIICNGFEVTRS